MCLQTIELENMNTVESAKEISISMTEEVKTELAADIKTNPLISSTRYVQEMR